LVNFFGSFCKQYFFLAKKNKINKNKKNNFEQQMPKQEKIDRKKREIQRDFGAVDWTNR
jgi:hypothetical protein